MAATFQIRPWDWTPLVIGRVIHETGCFAGCVSSRDQQFHVCESFINEVLFSSKTKLGLDTPPVNYTEAIEIAEAVVGNHNGRRSEILWGKNTYGAKWDLKEKEQTIANLQSQVKDLRAENTGLRQQLARSGVGGGYTLQTRQNNNHDKTPRGRGRGRGGGRAPGLPPGIASYVNGTDPEFEENRKRICLLFNLGKCTINNCSRDHACNVRVALGTPCGHVHASKDHQ